MKNKRIIIKLSGESFAKGEDKFHIDTIKTFGKQIKDLIDDGYEIGVVVGGGNLWRGQKASEMGLDRSSSDYIGMTATILNGLILQEVLENEFKLETRTLSAIEFDRVLEPYIRRKAIKHMEKGRVVIYVAGTGSPYFTTDTTAALRACETGTKIILMAKNGVDGIYDKDPNKFKDAVRFDSLTYKEVFDKGIKIMDRTAITMCAENDIKLVIFSANEKDSIVKALKKENKFTEIKN